LMAVASLLAVAPEDRREPRRFDVAGAAIPAAALGALAWALSQIGPTDPRAATGSPSQPDAAIVVAAGLGIVGLILYGLWERRSDHPMTPPRLRSEEHTSELQSREN